ncbi:phenylalanine--tRNA ligase subunit beta [Pontibacter cellulosilyticus]|uniref:Phenylalanine--tRNA ligase beta subunit n=1 Tax=Pontibacter cellulosilyticus TaxID=1720253 RepID=A0A923N7M0_9BACT|nr:phenylalanine--tRNA ligase subunit beta [Pontibacter cellulosilyticus]MBC5993679.1 phenylalanine--tRNA ligase subunit beta [Pontibacter cellulosilyticus]
MLISFDWLKQLIHTDKTAEEVGALLTGAGLEVEAIHTFDQVQGGLEGIVLGEVLTCERHPDADKLSLTTVDIGNGTPSQIVCGAPNVAAGQRVVVATVNSTLYPTGGEPFKIKKSKIRGQVSEGMICAEDEIGIGTSHAGIMVLDTDLPNGTPAAEFFGLGSDKVFEIGLTPNRADAASHYGVARDLQALTDAAATLPNVDDFKVDTTSKSITVEVENTEACPRYAGVTITGLKVGPSPEWLQKRLRAIDLSPINNIVDITNYVLHELGQPLHAFDADKIRGGKIIVKTLPEGSVLKTLDGVERKLKATDLMICDAEGPMAIGGVFGGEDSGVSEETTSIFIESAYFSPDWIRRTGMAHGLKTDASFRFERGTDPNMVITALKRAALLVQEIAGGEVSSEIVDVYPTQIKNTEIELNIERTHTLIGQHIDVERIKSILTSLGIEVTKETETDLTLSVPPFKVDVTREADVVEEILRIYGFNNIEMDENLATTFLAKFATPYAEDVTDTIMNYITANGFNEIITNSITNSNYYKPAGEAEVESLVKVLNYNSEDLDVLRKSMVFSGLEVLRRNINRRQRDLKLVELGKVYEQIDGDYKESRKLALYMVGNATAESWKQPSMKTAFHDLASVVQNVLHKLNAGEFEVQNLEQNSYMRQGISYQKNGTEIARLGLLDAAVCRFMEVKEQVWYAELNWDYLLKKYKNKLVAEELPKFPEVRRDLSLVLDRNVTFDQVKLIALRTERKLLQSVNVFDVYEGDKIEAGKKAYALSFTLLDKQQTLTDKVIDSTMNRLMQQFEKQLGAFIRK